MKNSRTIFNQGFTIVELMIVVAIIGVLASIAIPQYLTYIERAKFSEGHLLAKAIKKDILDFYEHRGVFPVDNEEAGLPAPVNIQGKYVASVTVEYGAIHVKFNDRVNEYNAGKVVSYRPAILSGNPTGVLENSIALN